MPCASRSPRTLRGNDGSCSQYLLRTGQHWPSCSSRAAGAHARIVWPARPCCALSKPRKCLHSGAALPEAWRSRSAQPTRWPTRYSWPPRPSMRPQPSPHPLSSMPQAAPPTARATASPAAPARLLHEELGMWASALSLPSSRPLARSYLS
eukprot:scaffold110482_cov38-Tisochrysis_lutea.AAC.2